MCEKEDAEVDVTIRFRATSFLREVLLKHVEMLMEILEKNSFARSSLFSAYWCQDVRQDIQGTSSE